MSQFDVPMACTRNMLECLNQNHYETSPYGPVPDAAAKLRVSVNNMINALIVAMDAESQGIAMPPVAVLPEGQVLAETMEHELHREYGARLAELPPPPEPQPWRGPEHEPEPERRENTILT